MAAAPSLYAASTGLCADSIESVPGVQGLFALATYQVDKHEQEQAQSSTSSATPESAQVHSSNEEDEDDTEEQDAEPSSSTSPEYTRRGTCSLYYASPSLSAAGRVACEKVDMIETPAILDMKWSLTRDSDASEARRVLGVANAKGQITLHRLQQSVGAKVGSKLQPLGELQFNNRNALCLSLDFSDRTGGHVGGYDMADLARDTSMIVSQSDGSLAYLPSLEAALSSSSTTLPAEDIASELARTSIHKGGPASDEQEDDWDRTSEDERQASLEAAHTALNSGFPARPHGLTAWAAHDFEAWIAGFDCFHPTTVWSGGDDLSLKGWDVRSPSHPPRPTFTCSKPFSGGVTSLQSHHLREHVWAVGSYDSHLRLFDARMPARPLSETHVGGGVWRIKWHPEDAGSVLVGCMHDGFKVLRLAELTEEAVGAAALRGKELDVITRFDEHASLAYGCDWDRGAQGGGGKQTDRVYSCSFYDASLQIWDSQAA
ncbi:hypothetical protein EX895_003809 [Sporisorium graminicola]|uniref:methylated diphthine methylhydrolase n=1 Tax=Sporisorium graminicola TaxID=280036 RepID=A0A4U7KW23_9BASI|nr:hypothetical protein EX895_003809 [Sporisorium graminicola]TKY87132.1 hypothetical protein EX895_003809 [Sporisorium graminicola]